MKKSGQNRTSSAVMSGKTQPDRRLAKTRASISAAFFTLMQQRDWDNIAVRDICAEADVARSSFYAHFDGKTALLDHMISRTLEASRQSRKPGEGPLALLEWIVDHVTENSDFFRRVSRAGGVQIIFNRFKSAVRNELIEELQRAGAKEPRIRANFILGGIFDALVAWSKNWKATDLPHVKTEILAMARQVCGR